ncbi:bifunctional phosphopantothenoylcysteine decarboxylase/phosphopantothenate--cysteine ligase CoaBC [Acidiferrobacter sp.]|uniref:bifunctional phosphopantothenoylcysteine decarboxylase/phosphopantothenate--cysteine ligase CoaBC n=1 Tax=Acidiferrobacter sp. TaxID=1872107 RepID=UPI0026183024|nr:bifunctional phosphopantothenoylcysteine decarboxylase/phosphopantothenate--cysteine ligase CoaBC [Acidiferrobacter sp.]
MQDMPSLPGRRIVLGITGGIAAYKTPELVRLLHARGALVRVVLSHSARQFVTAGALAAVGAQVVDDRGPGMVHIELARWADAILIAPATAHLLSRLAAGAADDLLTTACLATEAPLCVAPAMNRVMWRHAATRANCALLAERAVVFIGPAEGPQACGEDGPGRMTEPCEIVAALERLWAAHGSLQGVRAVVTAGATYEALDPARGFTNRSTGKMGYALAAALADQGASVTLVSGPTALAPPPGVRIMAVTSAAQMRDAVMACREEMDVFVGAAAVADYRPQTVLARKLKKTADALTITFVRNPDILAEVAALTPPPFTVGFAAETGDLESQARAKRARKGIDLMVANPIDEEGVGFAHDDNRVLLIDKDRTVAWAAAPKTEVARALVREIIKRLPRTAPP